MNRSRSRSRGNRRGEDPPKQAAVKEEPAPPAAAKKENDTKQPEAANYTRAELESKTNPELLQIIKDTKKKAPTGKLERK